MKNFSNAALASAKPFASVTASTARAPRIDAHDFRSPDSRSIMRKSDRFGYVLYQHEIRSPQSHRRILSRSANRHKYQAGPASAVTHASVPVADDAGIFPHINAFESKRSVDRIECRFIVSENGLLSMKWDFVS